MIGNQPPPPPQPDYSERIRTIRNTQATLVPPTQ